MTYYKDHISISLEEIIEHNPCDDCKLRAFIKDCHCKEKLRNQCALWLRETGRSDEEIMQWLTMAGLGGSDND